jgi:hypothetical protein
LNNKNKLIKIKKMKTKEIKSKTVKVKPVKKTINNSSVEEPHVEPAILENNINNSRTLEYKLKSGRVISAPCADEFFLTLSRRAKLEYLEFCVRNDLKLSDLQDNFC